jgi:hypothetical protein
LGKGRFRAGGSYNLSQGLLEALAAYTSITPSTTKRRPPPHAERPAVSTPRGEPTTPPLAVLQLTEPLTGYHSRVATPTKRSLFPTAEDVTAHTPSGEPPFALPLVLTRSRKPPSPSQGSVAPVEYHAPWPPQLPQLPPQLPEPGQLPPAQAKSMPAPPHTVACAESTHQSRLPLMTMDEVDEGRLMMWTKTRRHAWLSLNESWGVQRRGQWSSLERGEERGEQ